MLENNRAKVLWDFKLHRHPAADQSTTLSAGLQAAEDCSCVGNPNRQQHQKEGTLKIQKYQRRKVQLDPDVEEKMSKVYPEAIGPNSN